jgi:hypothetical protein
MSMSGVTSPATPGGAGGDDQAGVAARLRYLQASASSCRTPAALSPVVDAKRCRSMDPQQDSAGAPGAPPAGLDSFTTSPWHAFQRKPSDVDHAWTSSPVSLTRLLGSAHALAGGPHSGACREDNTLDNSAALQADSSAGMNAARRSDGSDK